MPVKKFARFPTVSSNRTDAVEIDEIKRKFSFSGLSNKWMFFICSKTTSDLDVTYGVQSMPSEDSEEAAKWERVARLMPSRQRIKHLAKIYSPPQEWLDDNSTP
jgi:hypothetical protein